MPAVYTRGGLRSPSSESDGPGWNSDACVSRGRLVTLRLSSRDAVGHQLLDSDPAALSPEVIRAPVLVTLEFFSSASLMKVLMTGVGLGERA